jgi:O-antigen/teichoic acid export membrane protein
MGVIMRQSIRGTLANYVGITIGFVTTFFILTHYLTEEQVGLTRVLVDAAVLFSGLAQLGTTASMIRFYPYFKDEEKQDHGIFFWSLVIPFIGFFIYLIVFLFLKRS